MALSIKDPEADRLARELAKKTGESITEAITQALRDRLRRVTRLKPHKSLADELDTIALECAALPELDSRTADEIIGYNDFGVPE